jgi:hypothetical protein
VLGGKKTRTSVSNSTMSLYCVVAFLCSGPVLVRLVRGGVAASQSVFLLCGTIVSKGRMIGKKRGTTLDFTMKVIIFVCTLVNVYNMKKKRELIVTVVSITSLYF